MKQWSMTISIDGENVLHISHNELSGVDNIMDYEEEIRHCALSLLGFIGNSESVQEFPSDQD